MEKAHNVEGITFSGSQMKLCVDDREYVFDIRDISERLWHANLRQRESFEVSPSGYGIHWPDIDEDLSIDGLIGIRRAPGPSARTRKRNPRRTSKMA